MRILFTTQPALGHLHALVPLARACADAGHEVAFGVAKSFIPTIARSGFRAFPVGFDWVQTDVGATFPQVREVPPGPARNEAVMRDVFAGITAERSVPDLLALARTWPPEVVVTSSTEFGGPLAAEILGIPHAHAGAPRFDRPEDLQSLLAEPWGRLRQRHGLPPDPGVERLYHFLQLAAAPPRFAAGSDDYLRPITHFVRPDVFDRSGDEGLPGWVVDLPAGRPVIYATLGTVLNFETAVFEAILAGLRDEPISLILTVGRTIDPARFGPQPPHVHIERYVPQSLLLPRCDLMVQHGGYNSVIAALDAGLPQVLLPLGADQPQNATRCAALGVGRVVPRDRRTPEAIRDAVRAVLADPAYRQRAIRVREEMRAMPGLDHGVALLERLARERRPIMAGE